MKIAVLLNKDGNVTEVNNTSEDAAIKQSKDHAWLLVEDNPSFTLDDRFSWTVRSSDNHLVHISTGMTPDEEKTQADALLGKTVGTALATANTASQKADNAIAGLALLGKQVAAQNTSTDGGTK